MIIFFDIPVDGMKNGLHFPDEKVATLSVEKWCEKSFCPLSRVRYIKHEISDNGKVKYGRRDWKCCHGIKRRVKHRPIMRQMINVPSVVLN